MRERERELLDVIIGLDSASKSGHEEQSKAANFKEPEKALVSLKQMPWNNLLCHVEQKILKPWSDRQNDFIVFACLEDYSYTPINMLLVLCASGFAKGDTPFLEEVFSAAVQLQDHPNIGILFNNLGVMFSESVLYDKSEECFTKAKRCFECKQDHSRDAVATLNLAALQKICGDYHKAWYFCESAAVLCHDISMRTIKDVHLPGKLLRRVADLLKELGNHDKFQEILVIGVNFDISGASKSSLADLIKWSMKIQLKELKREKIDKEDLKEFTSCLFASMDQPDAVLNVDFIATVLIAAKVNCRTGYPEEAYKLLERLEASFHLNQGHNDPLYGYLLLQIGRFNIAFGRSTEAESGLRQATESLTRYFGTKHHTVALCKSLLGTCAVLQKNAQGASKYLNEALTVFKKSNHCHPEVAKILFKCACFDVVECSFLSAKNATEEAMDILSSSCGEASLKTAVGFIQSAVILHKDQSLRCSAVDKMEKGIALCYSQLGGRHHYPDVVVIQSLLGVLQLSLGRQKEAENRFIEVQREASSCYECGHVELPVIPEVMNLILPVNSDESRSKCFCLRAQVISLVNLVCMKKGDDRDRYLVSLVSTLEEHEIDALEIQDFAGQSLNLVAHRVCGLEKPAFCILFCDPEPSPPQCNQASGFDGLESDGDSDSSKLILSCSNASPCVLLLKSSSDIQEKKEFRDLDLALRESVSTLFLQSTIRKSYDVGRNLYMELIIPAGTGKAASLCSQIDCLPLLVALKLVESQEESVELNCLTSWPSSFPSESCVHVSYFSYQFLSHFAAECAFHHLISNVGKELVLDRMQVVEIFDVPNVKNIAYFSFQENSTSSLSFGLDSQLPILTVKCRTLKEPGSNCVCLSVQNALVNTMKLCEYHCADFETSVKMTCEGVGIDCRNESASSSCGLENKPEPSNPNVGSEKVELLSFMNARDLESHLERKQSADICKDAEAPSVSHCQEKAHGSADVCLCLLDCLLSNRHVSPEEEPASSSPLPSCDSDNQLDDLNQSFLSDGFASSLSLLPVSPSTCPECGPFLPNRSTSDSLPCVQTLKENGLLPVADETDTEVTSSKHLLENPSTPYAENNGSHKKLSEKLLPFSGESNLSSYEEVLRTGKGNPDSEAKDPGHLQSKSSAEKHPSNYDHKGGTDVHCRELRSAQCHTVQVNPKQRAACESVTPPSSTSVSQSSGAGTLLNECGGSNFLRDDELAALQHELHESQEHANQLEEQLKKSEAEKQQFQAELGRYLFLEDKGRRNQQRLLFSRASGSDQSRQCTGRATSALTSMDGRLLGGAGPLEEPSSTLQARLLEISDSLSADELKRMKFLARSKVNSFRLAKIREGFELFEELETEGRYPCAYIGQLLERIQRCDLLEKLGLPFPDDTMRGSEHLTEPQASLPSTDVLSGRREKVPLTTNRTSHVSTRCEGDDGVSRPEQRDCEHNLNASGSSAGSSDVTDHEMSIGHVNSSNERLSLQNAPHAGEQCPDSSDASPMSNSSCSSTVNSSDSLVRFSQTTLSNCTSQGSPYSSTSLTSSDSLSAAAASEMVSESGLNPTNSDEEMARKSHHAENVSENGGLDEVGASAAKNEEREEQPVDLCDGVVRTNKTDTRTCALGDGFVFDQASGTGSFGHDQSAIERHSVGVSSASSTDWERLGARPKRVQVQCPPPDPAPQEIVSPAVSDGLTGDFLARHSQDKALHESLYRDDADISLFNDTPLQGASYIDGMINSSESNKAKPYLGACQYTSGTDPYSRLGNPSLHGPSNGFGRIGLLGGFSFNENLNGNSGVATAPLPSHLGGNNFSFHGNYLSNNGLNIGNSYSLQSNFVNNGSRFTGVEHLSRNSYFPYEQRLGLASSNPGNQPVYSGMNGSGFPNYPWMGAVGYQPGPPVYSTQQSAVFSDNASTVTPRQNMRRTTQDASFTLGNQSSNTSNNAQTTSASAGNTGFVDVGNSGLPAPSSVSTCISSSSVVVSTSTSRPALACAGSSTLTVHNNDNDNNEIDDQGAAGGNAESSLAPYCSDANNDNSGGTILNRDFGTDSVESTDNSLLALEQRVSEACALVDRVLREREEREQFGREIERKEQLIREQRERERREREERELQEAERWPQQQEAITARSQWLCEHYQRHCRVRFPCCTQFYPCHRCHNNSRACDNEEAKACHATHLKCAHCQHEQEIDENSGKCAKCEGKMSAYFCSICKHFTSVDKNPYHCEKCGICRIHKDKSFHCEVCNVCLDKRLEGNHKCRPDSGHDECCICLEDAFSGCQILPCSHKVHRECAIAMIQNGIRTCPICRHPLYSPPRG